MEELKPSDLLKQKLAEGVVIFKFKKKDGMDRMAVGTVRTDIIQKMRFKVEDVNELVDVLNRYNKKATELRFGADDPITLGELESLEREADTILTKMVFSVWEKKEEKPKPEHLITYFDMEKMEFRSFDSNNLLMVYG